MPVYLLHGFRWPRPMIRIHIILQNIDDAAAEWLVAPSTTEALLDNFDEIMPDIMSRLRHLRFIEQYDPSDVSSASQPHAYVADVVEEVKLGVDIDTVCGQNVKDGTPSAIAQLRDRLAPEANVSWFVVVCGDEERSVPPSISELDEYTSNDTRNASDATGVNVDLVTQSATSVYADLVTPSATSVDADPATPSIKAEAVKVPNPQPTESRPRGLSKVFGSLGYNRLIKKKSSVFSRFGNGNSQSSASTPPVPKLDRP